VSWHAPCSRRRFLGTVGKLALGASVAYGLSKIPRAYGQVQSVYCGLLSVPVELDGQVKDDEWNTDTIPYASIVQKLFNPQNPPAFVTRMKREKEETGYTYFSMHVPTSNGIKNTIWFYFDRKRTYDGTPGADGVYNLVLDNSSGSGFQEIDKGVFSGYVWPGTPFKRTFNKESGDYDWKTSLESSGLEVELKVRSDKISPLVNENAPLPQPLDRILFWNAFSDLSGSAYLAPNRFPMISKEVLPDLQSSDVISFAAVLGTLSLLTLTNRRRSRAGKQLGWKTVS
jgi:hypothetical protein